MKIVLIKKYEIRLHSAVVIKTAINDVPPRLGVRIFDNQFFSEKQKKLKNFESASHYTCASIERERSNGLGRSQLVQKCAAIVRQNIIHS